MKRFRISARTTMALGLLALLVLGQTAVAAAMYRCGADGAVRASCCCPAASAEARDDAGDSTITKAQCCEVEIVRVDRTRAPAEVVPLTFATVVLVGEPVAGFGAPEAEARPARALPGTHLPHAPPLIITKHSLLV